MNLAKKIEVIVGLQLKYPELALTGSIALHVQRVPMRRNLDDSDIDFIISKFLPEFTRLDSVKYSNSSDFDFKITFAGTGIDILVNERHFLHSIVVDFKGNKIRVMPVWYIMSYKHKYAAENGSEKHILDFEYLYNL